MEKNIQEVLNMLRKGYDEYGGDLLRGIFIFAMGDEDDLNENVLKASDITYKDYMSKDYCSFIDEGLIESYENSKGEEN